MYSLSGGRWLARKRATSDPTAAKRGNARGAKGAGHRRQGLIGQPATGGTDRSWRKAAAFKWWHEPDESRGSRPDL